MRCLSWYNYVEKSGTLYDNIIIYTYSKYGLIIPTKSPTSSLHTMIFENGLLYTSFPNL